MLNLALNWQLQNNVVRAVNEIAGVKGNFNFVFREAHSSAFFKRNVMGHYNPAYDFGSGDYTTLTIELNVDSLPSMPNEYIAAVIYHESLHAILRSRNVLVNVQHEEMAETYRRHIADSLRNYFQT